MTRKLIETPIKEVVEDSQLGADVLDAHGDLLMPTGAILSLSAINRLTSLEIDNVTVIEKEVMTEEQLAVLKAEIENKISSRFREINGNPLMDELKLALINYRLKELDS